MPASDPIQGIPYQIGTDPPDGATLGKGIVEGVRDRLVMRFASIDDRDGKLTNPPDGAICWVDATAMFYGRVNGAWIPVFSSSDTGWLPVTMKPSPQGGNVFSSTTLRVRQISGPGWSLVKMRGSLIVSATNPTYNTSSYGTVAQLPAGISPPSVSEFYPIPYLGLTGAPETPAPSRCSVNVSSNGGIIFDPRGAWTSGERFVQFDGLSYLV